jgi:hypothetical protein
MPRALAGVAITPIGRIVASRRDRPMIALETSRGIEPLDARGWQHFA